MATQILVDGIKEKLQVLSGIEVVNPSELPLTKEEHGNVINKQIKKTEEEDVCKYEMFEKIIFEKFENSKETRSGALRFYYKISQLMV